MSQPVDDANLELAPTPLTDSFGRRVTYLRLSVTDRCDLRCVYCMAENQTFLPKADVLTLEELERLTAAFIRRGVRKLRLTGGEPLVRKNFMSLVERLSAHLHSGALDELTITTNGVLLNQFAQPLADAGVKRINVSLDTLDRDTFKRVARQDRLQAVLDGLEAAKSAGLHVKINTVALKDENRTEIPQLIQWAHREGFDLCLIEAMPVGEIGVERFDQHVSLKDVRADLASFWTLTDLPDNTGGPARYVHVAETGGRVGFITPLSHNFCETCNRVRVTCTGMLYTCLGHDDGVDLREPLRARNDNMLVDAALDEALALKPKGHDFLIERLAPASVKRRTMATTGG